MVGDAEPGQREYLPGFYDWRRRRHDPCRVLFAASEGDINLRDAAWELADSDFAGGIAGARRVLLILLRRGWIEFAREWPTPPAGRGQRGSIRQQSEPTEDAEAALVGDAEWGTFESWPDGGMLVANITDRGDAALASTCGIDLSTESVSNY